MNNPLKTIYISGNLKDFEFKHKVNFQYCDLNQGNWELAIGHILYYGNHLLMEKSIFLLSSNLVNSLQLSKLGNLTLQDVILVPFEIDVLNHSGVITLPLNWFTINNINEYIILKVQQWPNVTNILLPDDFQICFNVFLRRTM